MDSSNNHINHQNDIIDDDDDEDDDDTNAPNWLINDVTMYAKNSNIQSNNKHKPHRPSSIQTTASFKLSDADMKSRMEIYKNFALAKQNIEKKPTDTNDRIREKLAEVLATVDDDNPNKDNAINKLLLKVEDGKRKRREAKMAQYEIAFGKSLTPRTPTEMRKSSNVDTFNRAAIITNANSNNNTRSNSIAVTSMNIGSFRKSISSMNVGSFRKSISSSPGRKGSTSINFNESDTGENMQAVLDIALAIQKNEEKKKLALKKEKLEAHKKLFAYIACCKALKILRAARIISSSQQKMSIKKISNAVSKYRTIVNGNKLWKKFSSSAKVWLKIKLVKKKCALRLINRFVNDYSTVYGARVLKRFKHYRHIVFKQLNNYIVINRARCELIGLYWDKVERNYRKQCSDSAREIEKQKRRELAAYLKTLDKNSVEGKWNLVNTHQQQYMYQLDNVQGQYQKANEGYFKEPGSEKWIEIKSSIIKKLQNIKNNTNDNKDNKKKETPRIIDVIDPNERYNIIRSELRKKREILKVKRTQEENRQLEQDKSNDICVDSNMAKSLLSCESKTIYEQAVTMADLVQKQLEPSKKIAIKKVDLRTVRKNYAMNILTDTGLGNSWKQIIEEHVALDMKKKKESMQQSAPVETKAKPEHVLLQPGGGRYITTSSGRRIKIAGAKWRKHH